MLMGSRSTSSRVRSKRNVEIPGGRIVRGENELGVRTLGAWTPSTSLANHRRKSTDSIRVRMSATSNTFADPTTWNMIDGKQSVKLMRRQSGSNTVEIVDLVKGKLEEIKGSPDNC